ncbi:hypothetical protein [Mycobacterium sp. JS623]|uniref:hypothetical protein n=1 Tax=Mycobacterium sp. JS623 TaxID=212767 RepID=UPI0002D8D806|nr:hypothetical protein [Mycobacterium sp. JS623]
MAFAYRVPGIDFVFARRRIRDERCRHVRGGLVIPYGDRDLHADIAAGESLPIADEIDTESIQVRRG